MISGPKSHAWIALAALALAVGPALAHDRVPGPPQTRPVLLKGGDLYTVARGVLPATDLLFEGGRITNLGPELQAPAGAEVIDVTGRRVYPGLIAAATTLGLVEISAVRSTHDETEAGTIAPEAAAHIAYNPDSEVIPTVRNHGITTAEVAPQGRLIGGQTFITHLDGWTEDHSAVRRGGALQIAWPSAELPRGWWLRKNVAELRAGRLDRLAELRRAFEQARAYHRERGANPAREIDVRWEAMRPVFARERVLHVVADTASDIEQAVRFAEEFEVSLVLVGATEAWKTLDLLVEHDVPVILRSTSVLPLREDDGYDVVYRLPATLHRAGVRFALTHLSSDGWDVRNLPFHAGQAVAWGLPPEIALRSITLSAAEILGVERELGSLETGKEATLFVSTGDVLDTVTQHVTDMWIRGRRVDLGDRQRELYEKYRQKPAFTPPAR